ncbi:NOB1 family endonuclease, partial [Candidatus Altiarchaeota archaeon]
KKDDNRHIVPNSVLEEIRGEEEDLKIQISLKEQVLEILDPSNECKKRAILASKESGDYSSLSNTDIDVLALALEEDAVILTDDYAIQNTAKHLHIESLGVSQPEIKEKWVWQQKCEGCGRKYPPDTKGECPICGSNIKRKRQNTTNR